MPRALVFGAGLVGTFAARGLSDMGCSVVCCDAAPNAAYYQRFGALDRASPRTADVRDRQAVAALLRDVRPDVVLFAIGRSRAATEGESEASRAEMRGALVDAVTASAGAGARTALFVSSLSVYGAPDVPRLDEALPKRPVSIYGRSCADAEDALAGAAHGRIDLVIARVCGLFGPLVVDSGSKSAQLVIRLLCRLGVHGSAEIQAEGAGEDEYLYSKDLGRALAAVALFEGSRPGPVVNVGSGQLTSLAEMCATAETVLPGTRATAVALPASDARPRRPLAVDRLRRGYEFNPVYDLRGALADFSRELGLLA